MGFVDQRFDWLSYMVLWGVGVGMVVAVLMLVVAVVLGEVKGQENLVICPRSMQRR